MGDRAADEVKVEACTILPDIAEQLLVEKRENPTDDLLSGLVNAEVDGEQLDDFEIGAFFVLTAVAGSTKHTSSLTVRALTHFPEQRDRLHEDFDGRICNAVEEFIRDAAPVMTFRWTAVKETELGGHLVIPGDEVVRSYPSGCMDPDVFDQASMFDLARTNARDHVAFGGGGVYFCLGNHLTRSMLRALFRELLTRIPEFEAGEPEPLGTNFMHGVKRLPFRFTSEKGS